jgi:hypothetical protein
MYDLGQRWVSRMLERLLPKHEAEALVGDLLEEQAQRVRAAGPRRAALWYWGQIGRSLVPLLDAAFRRGDWVRAWIVGFVAYSVAASAEISARASVELVATHTAVDAIPVLIVYLATLVLAAYVVEHVRARAAIALGLLVALAAVVQLVMAAPSIPLWYRCAVLIAAPAAALVGRALFMRRSRSAFALRRRRTVA